MAMLGAATLHERVSGIDKAIINGTAKWLNWRSAFSHGAMVNNIFDLPPERAVADVFTALSGTTR